MLESVSCGGLKGMNGSGGGMPRVSCKEKGSGSFVRLVSLIIFFRWVKNSSFC